MATSISPELVKDTTEFHGHWCPGLAIGIRAAEWALKEFGHDGDEDVVVVAETDMCGVWNVGRLWNVWNVGRW